MKTEKQKGSSPFLTLLYLLSSMVLFGISYKNWDAFGYISLFGGITFFLLFLFFELKIRNYD